MEFCLVHLFYQYDKLDALFILFHFQWSHIIN